MNVSDWIGFTGVFILLAAYVLQLVRVISTDRIAYSFLNFTGAALACIASVMINYLPFVILEGVWALVSLWSVIRILVKRQHSI
ncbi:MAG: hypothetical protein JSS90_07665 [Bacteroidetes bacterium]|jgi:uncharacterized membrane protein YhaH (DUF805 family)|nr:hypothetical protein [Bacteroidota bacterium]